MSALKNPIKDGVVIENAQRINSPSPNMRFISTEPYLHRLIIIETIAGKNAKKTVPIHQSIISSVFFCMILLSSMTCAIVLSSLIYN